MNEKGWNQNIKQNLSKIDINKGIPIKKKEDNLKNNEDVKKNIKKNIKTLNLIHNQNVHDKNLLKFREKIQIIKLDDKLIIDGNKADNSNNNNNQKLMQHICLSNRKTIRKKSRFDNIIMLNQKQDKKEEKKNYNNPSLIVLENKGNQTYLNCVIRIISNIKDISKYYLNKMEYIEKVHHKIKISYIFSRVLYHLYILPPQNYSLEKFYNTLISYNPIFKGDETKDSIDFLIYFINELHEENKKVLYYNKNNPEIDFHNYDNYRKYLNENENTKINESFSWINKKVLKCWGCNNEKISFQRFFTYDLDFENALKKTFFNQGDNNNNKISVFDCIKYTSEEKNIYNIFCDKCNKKNNFNKKSSIVFSSKYIIFLNRGIDNEFIKTIRDNQIQIHINRKIDFSKIVENNNTIYNLFGFILYDTEKLEYISYCVCPYTKQWYKYKREEIISLEIKDFIYDYNYKLFPVILLYERNYKNY